MNTEIAQLKSWLEAPAHIVIIMHERPDGDAIGSSLGLSHYLTALGHEVSVIAPTEYPDFLKWIAGNDQVLIDPRDRKTARARIRQAEFVFCLDFNDPKRAGIFGENIRESLALKIMIDHHLDPVGFDDLRFWDDKASSTAEMVYRLMEEMGDLHLLTKEIAQALYVGILTDTGSFRFTNTSANVHRIVTHLVEAGVEVAEVQSLVYENSGENRLRFLGHCLLNCLHVLPELNTAYILVDRESIYKYDLGPGDTEGLVNYTLTMKGVRFGVLITEQKDLVKMSFRSKGNFAANEFATQFNGGGHFHAAGGRSKESLKETEKRFLNLLEEHKSQLV